MSFLLARPSLRLANASFLAAFVALSACKDDGPQNVAPNPGGQANPTAPIDSGVPILRYEDSAAGLERLFGDLLAAIRRGDEAVAAEHLYSLRLPNYPTFFGEIFGPSLGPQLASEYQVIHDEIGLLAPELRSQLEVGKDRVRAERFTSAGEKGATGYQNEAFKQMQRPIALYSVRLTSTSGVKVFHLWSFAHVGGTFRYLGKMKRVTGREPPASENDPMEYRLADAERLRLNDR